MMRSFISLIAGCGVMLGTSAAQDDLAKEDLDGFQGVWKYVALENKGKTASGEELKSFIPITFEGNQWVQLKDGKGEVLSIKLDPSKKPKAIDLTGLSGGFKGKTILGIYSLEGSSLKICATWDGGERPTAFNAEGGATLIVLRREKK
jgi:uncharacterized protein (TIGR03067 family)